MEAKFSGGIHDRYHIEQQPSDLIRVFDRTSKLSACYHADGMYRHGDLRAATLDTLLAPAESDYLIIPHAQRLPQPIEEGMPQ